MNVEKHTKKVYDRFGKDYQKSRENNDPNRAYNEYLELPNMIKAIGNIKNKKLLDIGCGAGVHIKQYLKKGAICYGMDLSKTMIELAKKNSPKANFKVGSMNKLPYDDESFDIVTASLSIDYIDNLEPVFKEINRVLKKNGTFYYSNESPIASSREIYEDNDYIIVGLGKFIEKKTGKTIILGRAWSERISEWEMVPGMHMKTHTKTFRTQLKSLISSGFELVDFIDCKPIPEFKKYNKSYAVYTKLPLFSIYVSRKK